jgi:hypothetical protein
LGFSRGLVLDNRYVGRPMVCTRQASLPSEAHSATDAGLESNIGLWVLCIRKAQQHCRGGRCCTQTGPKPPGAARKRFPPPRALTQIGGHKLRINKNCRPYKEPQFLERGFPRANITYHTTDGQFPIDKHGAMKRSEAKQDEEAGAQGRWAKQDDRENERGQDIRQGRHQAVGSWETKRARMMKVNHGMRIGLMNLWTEYSSYFPIWRVGTSYKAKAHPSRASTPSPSSKRLSYVVLPICLICCPIHAIAKLLSVGGLESGPVVHPE